MYRVWESLSESGFGEETESGCGVVVVLSTDVAGPDVDTETFQTESHNSTLITCKWPHWQGHQWENEGKLVIYFLLTIKCRRSAAIKLFPSRTDVWNGQLAGRAPLLLVLKMGRGDKLKMGPFLWTGISEMGNVGML